MPRAEDLNFLDNIANPERLRRRKIILGSLAAFVISGLVIGGLKWALTPEQVNGWECREGEWVQIGKPQVPPPRGIHCARTDKVATELETFGEAALPDDAESFFNQGTLVRNLPGLDPGRIYLAYNPVGLRVEKLALAFDDISNCLLGTEVVDCHDHRIDAGLKVRISGHKVGEYVLVSELETLKPDE